MAKNFKVFQFCRCIVLLWLAIIAFIAFMAIISQDNVRGDTTNFIITPTTTGVEAEAERIRRVVAIDLFGRPLLRWLSPARFTLTARRGASTSWVFSDSMIKDFQGELDRDPAFLVTDTMPHEITHMVLATYYRRPIPRWADEGLAMLSESQEGQSNPQAVLLGLKSYMSTDKLMSFKEYPTDAVEVNQFFAQSYTVTRYLVSLKGKRTFMTFLTRMLRVGHRQALVSIYGINVRQLDQVYRYSVEQWRPFERLREKCEQSNGAGANQYSNESVGGCAEGQCGAPSGGMMLPMPTTEVLDDGSLEPWPLLPTSVDADPLMPPMPVVENTVETPLLGVPEVSVNVAPPEVYNQNLINLDVDAIVAQLLPVVIAANKANETMTPEIKLFISEEVGRQLQSYKPAQSPTYFEIVPKSN